jgi:simple sugar transport system substrate-binding protein
MWIRRVLTVLSCLVPFTLSALAAAEKPNMTFGILMVGPYNDHGWSQAHYDAGKYIEKRIPGTRMIYIDKVNPADRPGVTIPQLVDDLVAKGCTLIIANSDDMKDGIREAALKHPETFFLHISGDDVLTGKAPPNLSNLMGRIEYAKMMAGFAAAMTTRTGKIGYLGPLVNEETRRVAAAAYLGARYAWDQVLKKNPADLQFQVTWIGFWFNIPGVTADPTQVAKTFYDTGFDVIISGIDTTEAVKVASQQQQEGKSVWALPYEHVASCENDAKACLGVPYFNWGPSYVPFVQDAIRKKWKSQWLWVGPDWKDINNRETTAIGFYRGQALSPEASQALDTFANGLGNRTVELFKGPLFYQDGSVFLKEGEVATDKQVWYLPQLLKGMTGPSRAN